MYAITHSLTLALFPGSFDAIRGFQKSGRQVCQATVHGAPNRNCLAAFLAAANQYTCEDPGTPLRPSQPVPALSGSLARETASVTVTRVAYPRPVQTF